MRTSGYQVQNEGQFDAILLQFIASLPPEPNQIAAAPEHTHPWDAAAREFFPALMADAPESPLAAAEPPAPVTVTSSNANTRVGYTEGEAAALLAPYDAHVAQVEETGEKVCKFCGQLFKRKQEFDDHVIDTQ